MSGIFIFLVLVAVSGFDLLCRIIPNSLCLLIASAGLAWQMSQHMALVPFAVLQALAVFALLVPVCTRGILGGGDVKLLAALAVGVTLHELLRMFYATLIAGGVLGCIYLLLSRVPMSSAHSSSNSRLGRAFAAERHRILSRESIPYGVAIALGWIAAVLPNRLEDAAWPFAWLL